MKTKSDIDSTENDIIRCCLIVVYICAFGIILNAVHLHYKTKKFRNEIDKIHQSRISKPK